MSDTFTEGNAGIMPTDTFTEENAGIMPTDTNSNFNIPNHLSDMYETLEAPAVESKLEEQSNTFKKTETASLKHTTKTFSTNIKTKAEEITNESIMPTVRKELARVTKKDGDSTISVIESAKYSVQNDKIIANTKDIYYTVKTSDKINLNNLVSWYDSHKYNGEFSLSDLFESYQTKQKIKSHNGVEVSLTMNNDGTFTVTTSRQVTSGKLNNWFSEHTNGKYKASTIVSELNQKIQEKINSKKTTTTRPTLDAIKVTTTRSTTYKDIMINHSVVAESITKMDDIRTTLDSSCSKIGQLLSDMSNSWQGSAAKLFFERVEEYIAQMKKYSNYLEEKSTNLNLCDKSYQDFEDMFKSKSID